MEAAMLAASEMKSRQQEMDSERWSLPPSLSVSILSLFFLMIVEAFIIDVMLY